MKESSDHNNCEIVENIQLNAINIICDSGGAVVATPSLAPLPLGKFAAESPIHREIFSKSYYINPKSGCIYHFSIHLDPNEIPLGDKLIGKA